MKPVRVFDLEIYKDYFLVAFRDIKNGKVAAFELFADHPLDVDRIRGIIKASTLVSFNGNNFDVPLLSLALIGADNATLKKASDAIILNNSRSWQLEQKFKFKVIRDIDHIDLIEVAPGIAGLKIYGGRLHCHKMQDLPIDPSASIAPDDRELLRTYCANDLKTTEDLYCKLLPRIELRVQMGEEYSQDLRSKSDAQIAEAVIKSEVEGIIGETVERPVIEAGTQCSYTAPAYIRFETPKLRRVLADLQTDKFVVLDSGKVDEPKWLKDLEVRIGESTYRMGIGGLHSTESATAHVADDDTLLVDRDVESYYPQIILRQGLAPAHMGNAFSTVYRGIVERRLAAKHSGDKIVNETLKITINGSFGKFGSKYSILYSPDLLIATTITGQLALLMLIEQLESSGIPVVSANTDGIVIACPKAKADTMDAIVFGWECVTGFDTEATHYSAIYSANVNNYLALKVDGGHKAKGWFAASGLAKNPSASICTDAVIAHLKNGTPIDSSVEACTDITKFVKIRSVKGGAVDQYGNYLGRAVRWYYSRVVTGPLRYKVNDYIVPRSEGAQALMELPDEFPVDVDHDWYITEAKNILRDIGATA